jgi:hypothetical protein
MTQRKGMKVIEMLRKGKEKVMISLLMYLQMQILKESPQPPHQRYSIRYDLGQFSPMVGTIE